MSLQGVASIMLCVIIRKGVKFFQVFADRVLTVILVRR